MKQKKNDYNAIKTHLIKTINSADLSKSEDKRTIKLLDNALKVILATPGKDTYTIAFQHPLTKEAALCAVHIEHLFKYYLDVSNKAIKKGSIQALEELTQSTRENSEKIASLLKHINQLIAEEINGENKNQTNQQN